MQERAHVKDDGKPNGQIVTTEAPLKIDTPEGVQKYPAGTMFHILTGSRKLPSGVTRTGFRSTGGSGYCNVNVHWSSDDHSPTYENEGSLRLKIARAEIRQWWKRSLLAGSSVGVTIELSRRAIEWLF